MAKQLDGSRRQARGRPRNPRTDRAILAAAVAILEESGLHAVTVSAVAARAGVARATIYLRWPTHDALLGAMTRGAGGGFPYALTGDIEENIRTGAAFVQRVFEGGHFVALLPELVAAVLARPAQVSFEDLAPNRGPFARTYRAAALDQGFKPDADPHLAFDMLLGAHLAYVLANGAAPPPSYAADLAEAVVTGMRQRAGTSRPG